MTFIKIEPNGKLSEILIRKHKTIFRVKYRNHLYLYEKLTDEKAKQINDRARKTPKDG